MENCDFKGILKKIIVCSLIVATVSVNFIGCDNKKSQEGVFTTKWENFYEGDNIVFYYELEKDPNLQKLKAKYDLDEVVKDSADELDKALNIMNWINHKMEFNKGSISTKEDAISILKQAENNSSFSDREFSIVFSQCASSLGLYVRKGEFRIKESQHNDKNPYYKVCEVWSSKYGKWVMLDVAGNTYMESEGKPLSAIELLNKGLDNVNTKGVKNIEKYVKKMKPYMYTYTIEIDNNIHGIPKSNSFVTYVPKGIMPEICIEGGLIRPTIFVNRDVVFNKPPTTAKKQSENKDKIPTLILSKKTSEDNKKDNEIILYGAAFKDSGMLKGFYISINNNEWMEINNYFTIPLKEGENNIRLSLDKKNVIREVNLKYVADEK
ncbi:hypothetical protein [Clostridium cochlearium]|jgi:hypothetical protein|uniref:Putative lipoprotein n=2 Tax=Clostridium cochlearium TaxID=1494 RepID=A0A239ZD10_CLOCO|nr:hypothetical protein [Clostridium cochlearium]MBE6065392.1 hypothetical protein [Clostridium cochlearium]MBU5269883.1 hypothetical protein [Clostridium cochlearium]MCR1972417.1 hypothetical protein [Clostridium cochlearium]MDU1443703.1 hypothetical protein [Clostridium cochlearium]NME96201.1 hypothetical protein [Clostridium cochlearium]